MSKSRKALLVVNLGTPDSPDTSYVRKFLSGFLNDRRVIDIPWLFRKILVNLFIVPFRSSRSASQYKKLWMVNGSPIAYYLGRVATKLSVKLKPDYEVFAAMRYGNPSLDAALKKLKEGSFEELTVFPLFPQYASSTSGSIADFILNEIKSWQIIPSLKFINQYYSHPSYINALTVQIQHFKPGLFSHVVFSYHSLPLRQINKTHPGINCNECTCNIAMPDYGRNCYKAACYETTRLLANRLGLVEGNYTTCFQSRMSGKWLRPFTDDTLVYLASTGHEKVLIVSPSFVADCLETCIELGEEYAGVFKQFAGGELVLVDGLNDKDEWIESIVTIIRD